MGGCIRCLKCGKILHSSFRHDFQKCSCSNGAFVDGGDDYCRVGAMDMSLIKTIRHIHHDDESIEYLDDDISGEEIQKKLGGSANED